MNLKTNTLFSMSTKTKNILLNLFIFSFIIFFNLNFGCKDKSYQDAKKFYEENKQELDFFVERIREDSNFIGIRITDPGFDIYSCQHPFFEVSVRTYKDDFNFPVIYPLNRLNDYTGINSGLKKWCEEKNVDFDLVLKLSDFAIENKLNVIGRETIFSEDIRIFMSLRTRLLNFVNPRSKLHFEDQNRTFKKIEGEWYYYNSFEKVDKSKN